MEIESYRNDKKWCIPAKTNLHPENILNLVQYGLERGIRLVHNSTYRNRVSKRWKNIITQGLCATDFGIDVQSKRCGMDVTQNNINDSKKPFNKLDISRSMIFRRDETLCHHVGKIPE